MSKDCGKFRHIAGVCTSVVLAGIFTVSSVLAGIHMTGDDKSIFHQLLSVLPITVR